MHDNILVKIYILLLSYKILSKVTKLELASTDILNEMTAVSII